MIGSRIKIVREANGWTQDKLAEAISASQQGVCSIEAGLYRPSPESLRTLTQITGFAPSFFDKGELPDFPFGSILYRAQQRVKHPQRSRAHALVQITFELATELAGRLRKIPINIPRQNDDPAICAQITRAALGLSPNTPVRGLVSCLERNGVFVMTIPITAEGFDGFSAWAGRDPVRPVVAMVPGKTAYRQVFTVAEELGHLVMHSPLRVPVAEAEKEAKQFAQEFLLPAEAMNAEMTRPVTLASLVPLKERWGVSLAFLAMRASTLSIITKNQHRHLIQQMRTRWGAYAEPGDEQVEPEKPILLKKMAQLLYPGNPVDVHKLSRDSGLPVGLLRQILDGQEAASQSGGVLIPFKPSQGLLFSTGSAPGRTPRPGMED